MKTEHWLRQRRKELRLNQEDLAARLQALGFEISRASVSHWENGRYKPPLHDPEFREAFAHALRMDVRELLKLAGYEVIKLNHSDVAARAAFIVDQLAPDQQELAISILEKFLEQKVP